MGSLSLLHWQFDLLHFKIIFSVSSSGERWCSLKERVAEVRLWAFRGTAFLMLLIHKAPKISQLCFRGSHHLPGCGTLSCSVVLLCFQEAESDNVSLLLHFSHGVWCNHRSSSVGERCPSGCLALPRKQTLGGPAGHANFGFLHLMGKIYPISLPMLLSTEKWYLNFFLYYYYCCYIYLLFARACMRVLWHMCGGQRSTCGKQLSFRSVGHRDRT